ncbi:MAG: hypothetical protein H7338_12620 [Candidatus Sericytochromatia bacterium]|nr:hypothetical protein [Candidatus Sericytochromatia bacterium]
MALSLDGVPAGFATTPAPGTPTPAPTAAPGSAGDPARPDAAAVPPSQNGTQVDANHIADQTVATAAGRVAAVSAHLFGKAGDPVTLPPLVGSDPDKLTQVRTQLRTALGVPDERIILKVENGVLLANVLPTSPLTQMSGKLADAFHSSWRPVTGAPADVVWTTNLLKGRTDNTLASLSEPAALAKAPANPAKLAQVTAISAANQSIQFVAESMQRDIVQVADKTLQQSQNVTLFYDDAHVLHAKNRFSNEVFAVLLPDDAYAHMRFDLLRDNPTATLATLGGQTLQAEAHVGGQGFLADDGLGSMAIEAVKVTYTTKKNWTVGAGILTSQQIGGPSMQAVSFRVGHNYWGAANVLIAPDGKIHLRGVDTQLPLQAWDWYKKGSLTRQIAVGGAVLAGAAVAVVKFGTSDKEMTFKNPLPEFRAGHGKVQVTSGLLGSITLGGRDDGKFGLTGKLTGGSVRVRENWGGGLSNEQAFRYEREKNDDGVVVETIQTRANGTNNLGRGLISHSVYANFDLQGGGLATSGAAANVVMPLGQSRTLSWNAGGRIGLDPAQKVSFGDIRGGMTWQPSSAIQVFGSVGYMKGNYLMEPNLEGSLIGSMMPPAPRGTTQIGPNNHLSGVTSDKGRMAGSLGMYIRL